MKQEWLQRRVGSGHALVTWLCVFVLGGVLYCHTARAVSKGKSTRSTSAEGSSLTETPALPGPQTLGAEPAPNAAPLPFARLVTVMILGVMASYLRLWRKFHRYWHLGVTTNGYAIAYMALGMILSWFFYIAGNHLGPIPYLQPAAPWIAGFLGIAAAYLAPVLSFRWRSSVAEIDQLGGLQVETSHNIAYAHLEEGVQDCIRKRMHKEVTAASKLYNWRTIKLAAQNALDLEMNFSSLADKVYKSERKFIDSLPYDEEPSADSKQKYEALIHILRLCQFRHLQFHLQAVTKEARP
jgi:hypothetical protein